MILKKELCGDYILTVTGTVDLVLTNEVTEEVITTTSITDEYSFTVEDGIYSIETDEGTLFFIENCTLFQCVEKMILSLLCDDCNGEHAQDYRYELNQFMWILDDILLLLAPTWINTLYGYSPEEIEDKQDSIELSQVWDKILLLTEECGCTDTSGTDRVYPFIFYDSDLVADSDLLTMIGGFLAAGQNKLYDFLKSGYSNEIYGNSDNTYVNRMNMIHYLMLWMIMFYVDRRNDIALEDVYTDVEYEESYDLKCIEGVFKCEDINVRPMIAAFQIVYDGR